jgi:hypothetical protein
MGCRHLDSQNVKGNKKACVWESEFLQTSALSNRNTDLLMSMMQYSAVRCIIVDRKAKVKFSTLLLIFSLVLVVNYQASLPSWKRS